MEDFTLNLHFYYYIYIFLGGGERENFMKGVYVRKLFANICRVTKMRQLTPLVIPSGWLPARHTT